MERWRVNAGTQVKWKDKLHAAGDEFTATQEQVDGAGVTAYVTKVRQQSAPKAANKAVAAPQPRPETHPVVKSAAKKK